MLLSKSKTTDIRRFRSSHNPTLRRWKNRSEETRCRLSDNEEESIDLPSTLTARDWTSGHPLINSSASQRMHKRC